MTTSEFMIGRSLDDAADRKEEARKILWALIALASADSAALIPRRRKRCSAGETSPRSGMTTVSPLRMISRACATGPSVAMNNNIGAILRASPES